MCGRYGLTVPPWQAFRALRATVSDAMPFEPHYNIAPTHEVLAAVNDEARTVRTLRWGLVPPWTADPKSLRLTTFNARIETIATASAFRGPFRTRRAAIAASGYFEWRRDDAGVKTPFWIARNDARPFFFAGLWEMWRSQRSGETIASCTIITQPPNAFVERIHSRMPVVLDERFADAWLAPEPREPAELFELLAPSPPEIWAAYEVGRAVGNVRNDAPDLIEPVARGA